MSQKFVFDDKKRDGSSASVFVPSSLSVNEKLVLRWW